MSNIIPFTAKERATPSNGLSDNDTYAADVITFLSEDDDIQAVYETLRAAGYRS